MLGLPLDLPLSLQKATLGLVLYHFSSQMQRAGLGKAGFKPPGYISAGQGGGGEVASHTGKMGVASGNASSGAHRAPHAWQLSLCLLSGVQA